MRAVANRDQPGTAAELADAESCIWQLEKKKRPATKRQLAALLYRRVSHRDALNAQIEGIERRFNDKPFTTVRLFRHDKPTAFINRCHHEVKSHE